MLIFGVRGLLSLKNCQTRPQNSFSRFSLKTQLFSKNTFNLIFHKKLYIYIRRQTPPSLQKKL